jgi:hypothetical protein
MDSKERNMPEANIPFSHMVVDHFVYANGVGIAHMIGTLQECRKWQLAHGKRATTTIVPF